jgi:cytochrome c-type biogenesis protein CcmH
MIGRKRLRLVLLALLLLGSGAAQAAMSPDEQLADPALEQRARTLGRELRCLVCQNQSIDDSDADLAKDLRQVVRDRLAMGDSDDEILTYVHARYGDFVLLRPPMVPATWALWFGPVVLLLLAGAAVFAWRRAGVEAPADWTAAEQAKLDRALGDAGPEQPGKPPPGRSAR